MSHDAFEAPNVERQAVQGFPSVAAELLNEAADTMYLLLKVIDGTVPFTIVNEDDLKSWLTKHEELSER